MMAAGFKSRFGRKASTAPADGTAPGEAASPPAEAAKPAPDPKAETTSKSEAAVAAEPAEKAGPAMPADTKPEPASEPPAGPRVARLVEGASRHMRRLPDLATMKTGLGRAATAAKPATVPAAAAAALILALGIGYGIGSAGRGAEVGSDQTRMGLQQAGQDVSRLSAELKSLRASFDGLKAERDKGRGELQARQAQLSDKIERVSGENVTRTSRLADQVEKGHRAMTERLEKLERLVSGAGGTPVAAAPTPPPKPVAAASAPPDVERTGSVGEKKVEADPRKTKVEGIYVRDIDDGFALIEMRNGGYMDVAVGYTVPGVGRVEAIERRGRQWVVVTPKGYIGER